MQGPADTERQDTEYDDMIEEDVFNLGLNTSPRHTMFENDGERTSINKVFELATLTLSQAKPLFEDFFSNSD